LVKGSWNKCIGQKDMGETVIELNGVGQTLWEKRRGAVVVGEFCSITETLLPQLRARPEMNYFWPTNLSFS